MSYTHEPRGDIKRLPKWAQEYIDGLTQELASQDNHIKAISSEHPGSNVALKANIGRPDVTLPVDSGVYFSLGESRDVIRGATIEVRHAGTDSLNVLSYGMGQLLVTPWSSNAIRLKVGPR